MKDDLQNRELSSNVLQAIERAHALGTAVRQITILTRQLRLHLPSPPKGQNDAHVANQVASHVAGQLEAALAGIDILESYLRRTREDIMRRKDKFSVDRASPSAGSAQARTSSGKRLPPDLITSIIAGTANEDDMKLVEPRPSSVSKPRRGPLVDIASLIASPDKK